MISLVLFFRKLGVTEEPRWTLKVKHLYAESEEPEANAESVKWTLKVKHLYAESWKSTLQVERTLKYGNAESEAFG
jgi:hypothetical protein